MVAFVLPFFLKRIHAFLNPCLLRALLSSSIRRAVKLSVTDIPKSFNLSLFEKAFLQSLHWTNLTIIDLSLIFSILLLLSMSFTESWMFPFLPRKTKKGSHKKGKVKIKTINEKKSRKKLRKTRQKPTNQEKRKKHTKISKIRNKIKTKNWHWNTKQKEKGKICHYPRWPL